VRLRARAWHRLVPRRARFRKLLGLELDHRLVYASVTRGIRGVDTYLWDTGQTLFDVHPERRLLTVAGHDGQETFSTCALPRDTRAYLTVWFNTLYS
jgi:hypothetical protein